MSMRLRGLAKKVIYGGWPRHEYWFPYFGTRVFFPRNSLIFNLACAQGIYESDVLNLVNFLLKPASVYLDVGANIGLMSIGTLATRIDCPVISVEPSPATLAYLSRTHAASVYRERWTIVPQAVAARSGQQIFFEGAPEEGAFSGLQDTERGGRKDSVLVSTTTIDELWNELGRPNISVMKIDIEGGERDALAGASQFIMAQRPAVVLEWTRLNLASYGVAEIELLNIAKRHGYKIFSIPGFMEVNSSAALSLLMLKTENFLMIAE